MSIQVLQDEEELIGEDERSRFPKVPTLPAAILQIVLCAGQIGEARINQGSSHIIDLTKSQPLPPVLVFLLPSLYDHGHNPRSFGSFSLLIYTHSAHWAAFLIIDQFLHHHHHKSRLQVSSSNLPSPTPTQGYLDFYIRTKNIRRAPFYILSVGNATLMIVVMILHDLCDSGGSGCSHTFSKVRPACGSPLTACRWTTCGVSSPWSPWWSSASSSPTSTSSPTTTRRSCSPMC